MVYSASQQYFIDRLRSELSMRVQKASGSSYQLIAKLGDDELWEDVMSGVSMFNSWPPTFTSLNLDNIYAASSQAAASGGDPFAPTIESGYSILLAPIMMCAMFYTGIRLQWFEAGKHFIYNDNGVSIQRTKQQDYAGVTSGSILAYLSAQMTNIKITIGLSGTRVKGQFSGMIAYPRSLTRGLRGTRLGSG